MTIHLNKYLLLLKISQFVFIMSLLCALYVISVSSIINIEFTYFNIF